MLRSVFWVFLKSMCLVVLSVLLMIVDVLWRSGVRCVCVGLMLVRMWLVFGSLFLRLVMIGV